MGAVIGKRSLRSKPASGPGAIRLESGSRVAVIGGGPAGSFFSYLLLDMARVVGLDLHVDVYEPRDYDKPGPASCNTCGGIVSESLVQILATEGIVLPDSVVQRGLDSYVLHTSDGSRVHIDTPRRERRIAAVHRGAGPRGIKEVRWRSFDGYLQELSISKGTHVVHERVSGVRWRDDRPVVETRESRREAYDLVAVAVGVNTGLLKAFAEMGVNYRPPRTSRTHISEFFIGQEAVEEYLGNSMHVFLLNIPRLRFSALIPKGDYVTMCLLGRDIDSELVRAFMESPQVRRCFPPDWHLPQDFCHCSPKINVDGAARPFADRMVFIGDCGVTRLYKDGIGAAYRTAKAAAVTALFEGISADDFRRHYWPTCKALGADNRIGGIVLGTTHLIKKIGPARRGVVRMVSREQQTRNGRKPMSMVLWDIFTGSAPYSDIFRRALHPVFLGRYLWNIALGFFPTGDGE